MVIIFFCTLYGLTSYAKGAYALQRDHRYDPVSGTSMLVVAPGILKYLRSELASHDWQHPIAVVPAPEAANGLPGFRTIFSFNFLSDASLDQTALQRWAGRTDKIFVILDKAMRDDGKAEAVLRSFVDYDIHKWSEVEMDGMVIYSQ